MGGIAGLITDLPGEQAKAQLQTMVGCMLHEPFYRHCAYSVPQLGCYVGWVSHDGSFSDCQFASSRKKDTVLVFSGENFTDQTPAASLLALYEANGERFLRELNGWFAGILVDLKRNKVLLFNDRYGLHRIYYTQTKDSLVFASEAKSLLAIRPESRKLDPTALGQMFAVGSVFDERTLFQDVSLVPGGSAWTIKNKSDIKKHRYFSRKELECQPPLPEDEFYETLRGTLSRVIPKYFRHSGGVAVSLTGGLDTRAIMAFGDHANSSVSYTYGGMFRDSFDVRVARQVARACGYKHEVLRLGPDFLSTFPELAEKTVWVTDGTLDVCGSHELYLSRLARTIAPVRLTGNYGSEILRGVNTFKPLRLPKSLFNPDFLPYIQQAARSFADTSSAHPVSFAAFREIPCNLYGRLVSAQSQLTVRSPYTDNELVSLAYQGPRDGRRAPKLWQRLIAGRDPLLASIPTDRGVAGRTSSIATLPARSYNYLLFKAEWYYDAGMPHWLASIDWSVSRGRPPLWFVGSHKIEHYRMWLRDRLFDWIRSMLVDSCSSRPYLNARCVKGIVSAHRDGGGNFSREINKLVTVELVHRLFTEGKGQEPRGGCVGM